MNTTQDQAPARPALSNDQIDKIVASHATKKGFRERPVRNFLSTLYATGHWQDKSNAWENMQADARSYGWTPSIVAAISKGIKLAYK